jgi:hypothetical protein
VGEIPHGQPHNMHPASFGLLSRFMNATRTKTALTFGDLVANFYDTYGECNAKGVLRLVIKANLVALRGRDVYVVSRATRKA